MKCKVIIYSKFKEKNNIIKKIKKVINMASVKWKKISKIIDWSLIYYKNNYVIFTVRDLFFNICIMIILNLVTSLVLLWCVNTIEN